MQRHLEQGFTLIELVMVIVIIGALSAIIVPNFIDYTAKSGAQSTRANIQILRSAIQTYRSENSGSLPGTLNQLVTDGFLPSVPEDGINNSNAVQAGGAADNSGGWIYFSSSGVIKPNLNGADAYSKNFSDY
ncbi:MAG: type II secretion system protein [Planctomycetota bacterium]